MIRIGEHQTLTIKREMPQGYYLEDEEDNEVLFPRKYITADMEIGQDIEVFVYCDSEDLDVATTEKPLLTVGDFATLVISDVNSVGAFCKWGVTKELFIPYRNQDRPLKVGDTCVVHMYLDEESDRLVGTTKLRKFLKHVADDYLKLGEQVELLVYNETDLGFKVIVEQIYSGLLFKNELPKRIKIGESLMGYIKTIREDKKIDISLFPIGHQSIEPNAAMLLTKLEENGGFIPFNDRSSSEAIWREFKISKKLFKKATGTLYKQRKIILKPEGIFLTPR
jgi:uncharacterized protein